VTAAAEIARRRRSALAALVVVLVLGAGLRAVIAVHHARVDFDEGRYLDNALHVLHGEGFLTNTVSLYFGDPPRPPRPEDFSSPLYPYALAGLFAVSGVSFTAAKILGVILSVAMIPLTFLLGRKIHGIGAGLVAATAIAFQPDQAIVGAWAMTEAPYALLVLAALIAASGLALPRVRPFGWSGVLVLGTICGLLYLMRQNGVAVAATVAGLLLLGCVAEGESRIRRLVLAACVTALALAVCLPWFVRNESAFGSPAYSRMKNVAWAESGASLYTPGIPAPTFRTFLEEHGIAGLADNVARRAGRVSTALFLGEEGPFRILSLLAFLSPLLTSLRPSAAVTLPPVILSSLMFLGVAPWSGALPRYFLPLRPLLYIAGAAVILEAVRLARAGKRPVAKRAGSRGVVLAVAAFSVIWAALSAVPVVRAYLGGDQAAADGAAREAAAWIADNTKRGEVLLEGGLLHEYAWIFDRGVVWVPNGNLDDVRGVADHYDAAYLAVTPEVLRFRPALSAAWEVRERAIRPREIPDWLTPVYDRGQEGVLIYRIDRHRPEAGRE